MRLLFIAADFPNPLDATHGVFNMNLARALAREGEVSVVAPVPWALELKYRWERRWAMPAGRRLNVDGVTVRHPRYWYTPGMLRSQYGRFYRWSTRGAVWRAVAEGRPDVVLSYWVHPDGEAAAHVGRELGVPAGVIVGGSDVLLMTQSASRRRQIQRVVRSLDFVLTVNQHLREKVIELGADPDRVHVWEQGVDTGLFAPGDQTEARRKLGIPAAGSVLVWVGRMVPVKGLEVLVKGVEDLRNRGTEITIYLVGDGPLRGSVEMEARIRGLDGIIRLVGSRLPAELGDWYRAADLTVLTSWSEGLPNVLRESLACGTPFVASRVGGIPEIAGEADRLFPAGDVKAFAVAVLDALAQRRLGIAVPARSQDWAASAQSLLRIVDMHRQRRMASMVRSPTLV